MGLRLQVRYEEFIENSGGVDNVFKILSEKQRKKFRKVFNLELKFNTKQSFQSTVDDLEI